MELSKSAKAAWLAGFWDGEGSVVFRSHCNGRKHTTYYLSVCNTDLGLIETCATYLSDLGISHTKFEQRVRRSQHKPLFVFHICQADSIRRFAKLVPLHSPAKRDRLDQILAWVDRPQPSVWDERKERIVQMWDQGHSLRCITTQLGLRPAFHHGLALKLREWGIDVPPHGKGRRHCGCLKA